MRYTLNGEPRSIDADSRTIIDLLRSENVTAPESVSVQLNGTFVRPESFASAAVQEGDEVDFLYFMGGGSR
jgi:sulfur carrier protein